MKRLLEWGVVLIIGFGACFQAAHDLWAATFVFLAVSVLFSLFVLSFIISKSPLDLPLAWPLLGLLTAVWVSSLFSIDLNSSLQDAWGWTFGVILFYILLNTLQSREDCDRFMVKAGLVIFLLLGVCLWQRAMGSPETLMLGPIPLWQNWKGHPDSWGRWEIMATLVNSVVLSGFILNWVFVLAQQARERHVIALAQLIAAVAVLILARSFWAFACLGAGVCLWKRQSLLAILRSHPRLSRIGITLTLGLLIGLTYLKISAHHGPYIGFSRFYYWTVAFQAWRAHPLLGIGLGSYKTFFPYFQTEAFQSTLFVHNTPLQWLCETGVVGFAALLVGVFSARKALKPDNPYSISLIVVFLYSLVSINLDFFLNKILIFVLLAGAVRSCRMERPVMVRPPWLVTGCISLWMLSIFWARIFFGSQLYVSGRSFEEEGNLIEAQSSYLRAIQVDPANAEAHARLASLDPQNRRSHLEQAVRFRKDKRYVMELTQLEHRTTPLLP